MKRMRAYLLLLIGSLIAFMAMSYYLGSVAGMLESIRIMITVAFVYFIVFTSAHTRVHGQRCRELLNDITFIIAEGMKVDRAHHAATTLVLNFGHTVFEMSRIPEDKKEAEKLKTLVRLVSDEIDSTVDGNKLRNLSNFLENLSHFLLLYQFFNSSLLISHGDPNRVAVQELDAYMASNPDAVAREAYKVGIAGEIYRSWCAQASLYAAQTASIKELCQQRDIWQYLPSFAVDLHALGVAVNAAEADDDTEVDDPKSS